MHYGHSNEQLAFRDTFERFIANQYKSEQREHYQKQAAAYDVAAWKSLCELGFGSLPVSPDHGGLGGSMSDMALSIQALAPGLVLDPWLPAIISTRIVERIGSLDSKTTWLGPLMSGDASLAVAIIDHPGFDRECRIRREGGHIFLHGSKSQVLGPVDHGLLVTAESEDGSGLCTAIVQPGVAGMDIRSYRLLDGSFAHRVSFERCEVQDSDFFVAERGAEAAIMATLAEACLLLASEAVGIMDHMLSSTADFLRTRRQFGVALGSFQAIQHRLADCAARLELARSLIARTAAFHHDGVVADRNWQASAFGAKAFSSSVAVMMAEECVQFHGAMGLTEELWVGRAMKRLLLIANLFGDERAQTARADRLRMNGQSA